MEKGSKLSGKLLDANGRVGSIDVTVDEQDETKVTWRIRLLEREHVYEFDGRSVIKHEGDSLVLETDEKEQKGRKEGPPPWSASLRKYAAGRYAETAWMGEYHIQQRGEAPVMSDGVVVVWSFK